MTSQSLLIGVSGCLRAVSDWPFHMAGDKYLRAVVEGTGGQPVIVPALGDATDWSGLLARLDGLMLTGSPSNVEPHHYDGPPSRAGVPHDPARDATTLPLIRAAVQTGVPILAICRGIQEMNVAFGGSLHQHLAEVPGRMDHRRDPKAPRAVQYGPRHRVRFSAGGLLEQLAGAPEVMVNSLHGQGLDRIGPALTVEAVADDGTIEAVRVQDAAAFALGVQWHVEWELRQNPLSAVIFAAFAAAARRRAQGRSDAPATAGSMPSRDPSHASPT